tara:strand:- start:923 stop:2356 length:1434 start_codon:yes stop_codon:yes gene_type:complete
MLTMRNLYWVIIFLLIEILMPAMAGEPSIPLIEMAKPAISLALYLPYIFIGSGLILTFMCLAWARALHSYSMAILALFFAIKSLAILAAGGISLRVMFTGNSDMLNTESLLLTTLSNIILFGFIIKLVALKRTAKSYYHLLIRVAFVMVITVPLSYLLGQTDIGLLTQLLTSVSLIALVYVIRKVPENRLSNMFFLILLVQLSFNVIVYFLYFWDFSVQVINGLDMLAFLLMAIMVTYLMGRKYYCHIGDEKFVQQQVLASAKASEIAQQELLTLQEESQEQLESRVQERTLELHIALQELETANQELKEKNTLDALSGLYNRRYYDQKIMAEFRRSRRNLTPLSLVMVDIDHFKRVNDSFGHLAGDKCIVEVAAMIKSLLRRSSDVGCRYGGEEFCLILPETDEKGALAMAEDICQSIRQQKITHNASSIDLTVSCGVTTYQQEKGVTPEIIFECVDKALYKAKQAGRDQVQVNTN